MSCDDVTVAVVGGLAELMEELAPSRAPPLPVGTMLGRYVIAGVIGSGGMGTVYAAYDPELDRKVALKLIRRDVADDFDARARLVREANALARVSHPNVVVIYDACVKRGELVLAMELLEGITLAQWLAAEPRSAREILEVFELAGRGLAAAHAAEIVHRDFKPGNVIIETSASAPPRVRVLDFGLAQPGGGPWSSERSANAPPPSHEWNVDDRVTRPGYAVGTPRYMSPEQRLAWKLDARSDQYSFCVALWEALFGMLPAGHVHVVTPAHRSADSQPAQPSVSAPRRHKVSRRLRAALDRGMAGDADRRFPTMEALLDVLARERSDGRMRTWIAAAAIGCAAIGAVTIAAVRADESERCAAGAERWEQAWSDERRDAAAAAFAALGDHATTSWQRTSTALDEYGAHWQTSHREVCLAAHERAQLDASSLDARMGCLQRAHRSAAALGELLVVADDAIARNAVRAIEGLPDLGRCDRLAADAPDPFAPTDPAQQTELRERLDELARIEAELAAGRHAAALEPAEALVAEARALEHGPLLAESLFAHGRALADAEQFDHALAVLEDAEHVALAHGHDEIVPLVINQLVYLLGYKLGRHDDALAWGRHGLASAERVAVPEGPRGRLLVSIGNAHEGMGETELAKQHYTQAIELLEVAYGDDSPYVARAINSLGNSHYGLGELDEADAAYRRAHAIWSAALGDQHPDAVIPLTALGRIEMREGRLQEGKRMVERVLAVWRQAYGERHSLLTIPLSTLAEVSRDLGDWDAAIAYDMHALAIYEATLGPDHPNAAFPLYGLGMAHYEIGRFDEAEPYFRRALAIRERAFGPHDPRMCLTLAKLALVATAREQHADAIAFAERALAIGQRAYPPENPNLARLHHTLGEVLIGAGELEKAVPQLERTIALRPGPTVYHPDEIPLFDLAKAYHALGRDPLLVAALAEAGAMRYAAWPEPETAAEIRRWAAANRRGD